MILIAYGTRPEYLKLKPVIDALRARGEKIRIFTTGQHKDLILDDTETPEVTFNVGHNRLDDIVSSILQYISSDDHVFEDVELAIVQGDTSSALAVALSAFHHKVSIAHVEAGLRTWDLHNPYPEESNRQLISRLTNFHFCPTEGAANNLKKESLIGEVYVVGNTIIDVVKSYDLPVTYENHVLVTMHRRENQERMQEWVAEIDELAEDYEELSFIMPTHPGNSGKIRYKFIDMIPPMDHKTMCEKLASCRLVITDSGGLQEEGAWFNKRILVCRERTERPEGLGTYSYMVRHPEELVGMFEALIKDYIPTEAECPYGDGTAGEAIAEILCN